METTSTQADAIPMFRELLARRDLSRAAVLMYGVLSTLDHGDGVVVSMRELSVASGISPNARSWSGVRQQIRALETAGLVERSGYNGGAQRYRVLGPKLYPLSHYSEKVVSPAVSEDVSQSPCIPEA